MDEFLTLNKRKLPFVFLAISGFYLALTLCFLLIEFYIDQFFDPALLLRVILIAGIGIPAIILVIGYLEWLAKRRVRRRGFSKSPFNELDKIGFSKILIYEKSKWHLTRETTQTFINGFKVTCDVTSENPKSVQFIAYTEPRRINKRDLKTLRARFNQENIHIFSGQPIKMYATDGVSDLSIEKLKNELDEFIGLLKQENFEPEKTDNE